MWTKLYYLNIKNAIQKQRDKRDKTQHAPYLLYCCIVDISKHNTARQSADIYCNVSLTIALLWDTQTYKVNTSPSIGNTTLRLGNNSLNRFCPRSQDGHFHICGLGPQLQYHLSYLTIKPISPWRRNTKFKHKRVSLKIFLEQP